jgi:hypothetical protein
MYRLVRYTGFAKMSKKVVTQSKPGLDRLADWLGRQSRLVRSMLAGLVALSITGLVALLFYGFLLSVPPGSLNIGPVNPGNVLTIGLIALSVIGFVLYWLGWRVLIGFDYTETPLQPGRPAALWVLLGLLALIVTVVLVVVYVVQVITPG